MQFNSIQFIFYFLPLFLAVFYIFPAKFTSVILLIGSLVFYAFASGGNYWWVAMLAVCTVSCYLAGQTLEKPYRKTLLIVYLSALALLLAFFKLYKGGKFLPAGMSFYLFQMAAYLIDVYRRKLQPQRSIISFAGQMAMFPKLLSGPLMEPVKLHGEEGSKPTHQSIHDGIQLLILGLGLKVILANRLGGLWAQPAIAGYESISTPAAWLALSAYAMQLYFDFYGYSLMAMGLGKMLGFDSRRILMTRMHPKPFLNFTAAGICRWDCGSGNMCTYPSEETGAAHCARSSIWQLFGCSPAYGTV